MNMDMVTARKGTPCKADEDNSGGKTLDEMNKL